MENDEILRKNFIKYLDRGLQERGWSMRELARRCPISQAHLSNIKRGKRSVTWDVVAGIARAFGEMPETALREIGLLPNHRTEAEKLQEILNYLSDEEVEEVLRYAEFKRHEPA